MLYEYKCYNCNLIKEVNYDINEEHTHPICPKCNECTSRVFTTAIHFKGGGWPSENVKIAREAEKIEEIQAEGWRSTSEMETGMAMEKEHIEKQRKAGRLPAVGKKDLSALRDKQAALVRV